VRRTVHAARSPPRCLIKCAVTTSEAHSAGLEPGALNPFAVEALQELGIDISRNKTQSVFDVWKSARHIFTYAITVCSESEAEACPIFAGVTTRLHWPFDDPSKFTGTHEDVGSAIRSGPGSIRSAKNTASRAKREEARGGIHRDIRSRLRWDRRDCD